MKNFIIIAFIAGFAITILFKSDTWKGFYYPDGCLGCSEDYIYSPEFKTKEQCFDWGNNLKRRSENPNDTFECGRNCKEKGPGMYLCKETVD